MKTINLIHYSLPDRSSIRNIRKLYSISYGDNLSRSFSRKDYLTYFLTWLNKELNSTLDNILFNQGELYKEYYRLWYYADNFDKILINLDEVNLKINYAVSRCQMINGNNFVFLHLSEAIDYQIEATEKMIKLRKKIASYSDVRIIEAINSNSKLMKLKLATLGQDWKP